MREVLLLSFLMVVSSVSWSTTDEDNLTIEMLGAWAQGNTTFYIVVDRQVGPAICASKTIKVNLGGLRFPEVPYGKIEY